MATTTTMASTAPSQQHHGRGGMRLLLILAIFFLVALLTSAVVVDDVMVEDDAIAKSSTTIPENERVYCADDDDAANPCSSTPHHNSQSWFEDASQEGLKFLQHHVFGQKQQRGKRSHQTAEQQQRQESFAHLTASGPWHHYHNEATDDDDGDAAGQSPSGDGGSSNDDESTLAQAKTIWNSLSSILQSDRPDEALLRLLLSTDMTNVGSSSQTDNDKNDNTKDDEATTRQAPVAKFQTQSVPTVWSAWMDTKQLFLDHAKEMLEQLQRTFSERLGDLLDDHFHLPAIWFYLRLEQERKNAAWKRRQHRFHTTFAYDTPKLRELHQALYLSQLAYEDTEHAIRQGLAKFQDNSWELLYCDTEGIPSEPAHFLAVQKQSAPLHARHTQHPNEQQQPATTEPPTSMQQPNQITAWWRRQLQRQWAPKQETEALKVLLVVRGTKTVGDVLSDGLLEPVPYRGTYQAHGGIKKSGEYMVAKHLERLRNLLEASGRSKLQLFIFGHSLGAGTAAIAAIEFNDYDFIEVRSVGFGCPSLISPELSEQYKDIITTVVSDADVIPRMSGASLVNLHLNMMQFDWTDFFLEEMDLLMKDILKDITAFTNGVGSAFATDVMDKIREYFVSSFDRDVRPGVRRAREISIPEKIPKINGTHQLPVELIPPGTCIHVYRNGVGFDATYTPCTFFSEIEFVPNFVADHLIKPGYHWALLSLLRQQAQDYDARFENEI